MVESPTTLKTQSFWCFGKGNDGTNHDKVYRLEIQEFQGKYDVFALYGHRTKMKTLLMHVLQDGIVSLDMANKLFNARASELLKKEYVRVNEDVADTRELTELKAIGA